jgi:hypothetical protein
MSCRKRWSGKKKHKENLMLFKYHFLNDRIRGLSSFYFVGFQAFCAYVHSFDCAIHIAFYSFDVGLPNVVGSSMRMAYVISKMNALTTNITFSHLYTS